ncbi:brix domain-containing protein [Colletotrichum graminicola]|uniref:Brix domain-containing protein n=1 Tax=Colletotrichum graminicola (strain M1.001 / M2 / FGSC 10212) TaxID=645133 RepID=E3QPZ3_COLGM|nr:brix domain-containing protein [Colletotrichum graminicola M1.001]EFQ32931.1 brix domain-containing protein [Colletotrichum graminicola M1.001]WDK09332.1 brix domain-containing protein [Colletotrichum graminicola]
MASVYKSLSKKTDKVEAPANGVQKNRQKRRTLILSSRGVTYRHRHLMNDLATLMPHGKLDSKFDEKHNLSALNELAEMMNCNGIMYFEARKAKDLYMWISNCPNGPAIKFHLQNIHTMGELNFNFPGNCLKGSRPILSFDAPFDDEKNPHLQVIKQAFIANLGVPQGARKAKPFIDRVIGFSYLDGKVWIRQYQVQEVEADENSDETTTKVHAGKKTDVKLLEIGPRFTATPILIQEGSFGGPLLWNSKEFVSPNQIRADIKRKKATRHVSRVEQQVERMAKKGELGIRSKGGRPAAKDELDTKTLFA